MVGLRTYQHAYIIIIGGILVLFVYIKRIASNEIFSQTNKTHRELGRAKDLSAPLHNHNWRNISTICIYKKTSIKRNILTNKQNKSGIRSG
jgi:hypothetical protein